MLNATSLYFLFIRTPRVAYNFTIAITADVLLAIPLKFNKLIFEAFIRFNYLTASLNIVISLVIAYIPLLHHEHDNQACRSGNSKSAMDQYSILMITEGLEHEIKGLLKVSIDVLAFDVCDISVHVLYIRFKGVHNRLTSVHYMCDLKSVYNVVAQCLLLTS